MPPLYRHHFPTASQGPNWRRDSQRRLHGDIEGLADTFVPRRQVKVTARGTDGLTIHFSATARIDTPFEVTYYQHGGILQYVLRQML